MHYYSHHIGDFIKDTHFLTNEEIGIYLKLIWLYYDTEKPLPNSLNTLSMKVNCRENKADLLGMLETFFILIDDEWHHTRCDKEIAEYTEFCAKQKANGLKGGRPKTTQTKPKQNPVVSQDEPKETLTTNHKPITNNQLKPIEANASKATRLKIEYLPEEWSMFCRNERPDLEPNKVWDQFKDYWVSVAGSKGVKADWLATWRNWVRNQKSQGAISKNNSFKAQDAAQAASQLQAMMLGTSKPQERSEACIFDIEVHDAKRIS